MAVQRVNTPEANGCGTTRLETGAVQFGDDWPGLFVRGDNAISLAGYIDYILPHLQAILDGRAPLPLKEFDLDHIDMAVGALSGIRRIIYEEVQCP
ncbi:hypothetical protein [Fimbriiglobus ruber]|uniref:Uncharacterized protein n=1 Tax=Fimbriiglobus ruber TaxID=1908690 RepID=A0A225D3J8_9BACT|nr:hypothetical protein [Fimbriiglobus ruber]OWK36082.1 hypothetical protein FRUB_08645 [Fimbriiglobus ruber]